MALTLQTPGFITESGYQALVSGSSVFRSIRRRRLEFTDSDSAVYQLITPVTGGVYTYDQFTSQVRLNTTGLLNEAGTALKFARAYLLHMQVVAYREDQPASGSVSAAFTALFAASATHALTIGDACLFACNGSGTSLSGSTALALTVTSPVNLAIELLIIGKES